MLAEYIQVDFYSFWCFYTSGLWVIFWSCLMFELAQQQPCTFDLRIGQVLSTSWLFLVLWRDRTGNFYTDVIDSIAQLIARIALRLSIPLRSPSKEALYSGPQVSDSGPRKEKCVTPVPFLFILYCFSMLQRWDTHKTIMRLDSALFQMFSENLLGLLRKQANYWTLCYISSFPVTAQLGNYLQLKTLMMRSDVCESSALPGGFGKDSGWQPSF